MALGLLREGKRQRKILKVSQTVGEIVHLNSVHSCDKGQRSYQDAYSLSTTKSLMTNPFASLQRSENMLSSNATL